jgi:glutamine amidotransferase
MIIIIDYGMGNLRSVAKGFEKVGFSPKISRDPEQILAAEGVVLPGVGAFGRCMDNIIKYGLVEPIKIVEKKERPFLGICLGLQLLFDESEEFGPVKGLGLLPGKVVRFPQSPGLKVPQMGWNSIEKVGNTPILADINSGDYVYFVHSYYVVPERQEDIATLTEYGVKFVSSVSRGNLFATQFHPEKSGKVGLKILENFGKRVLGKL